MWPFNCRLGVFMRHAPILFALALSPIACGSNSSAETNGDASNGDYDNSDSDSDESNLVARIVRPNGDLSILSGTPITFEAEFFEGGTSVFPAVVNWDTHVFLGDGNPLADVLLADGVHVVTVSTTYKGSRASDSITVTVGSLAVRVLDPDNGAAREIGTNVRFRGEAFAVEPGGAVQLVAGNAGVGQRLASYAWSSDLDGPFGGGQNDFLLGTLRQGRHIITLSVTDDAATSGTGLSGSATVALTIRPPNTAPVATITAPTVCPVEVDEGATLAFAGTVDDPDEPDLQGIWLDTATGETASGGSFSVTAGSLLGLRTVVFSAADALGATDTASCEVWVVASGKTKADLFPDTSDINAGLVGGNSNVNWIGAFADGNTWVATDQGITLFDSAGTAITTYDGADLGVGAGAEIQQVAVIGGTALVATEQGLVQCGYAAGALASCLVIRTGEVGRVGASADPAASGFVAAAVDGGLFLAAFSGGTRTDDQVFAPGNSNLPSDGVEDLEWAGGALYVATEAGLCIVKAPAGALSGTAALCTEALTEATSLLPSDDVRALVADGATLWIGTNVGLVQYDTTRGSMAVWDERRGLSGDARAINDIAIDAAGILWLGTDNGLVRLNPAAGSVTVIDGATWVPPAPGRDVHSVHIDAAGVKWLATSDGVVQYSGQ